MVGAAPATTDPVICSVSSSATNPTSCVVPGQSGATGKYYVVARAPACCGNSGTDESARPTAANTVTVGPNVQPNPPLNLALSYSNGMEQLSWNDPVSPAAGEAGDTVRYFRIYKDGLGLANRYDKVDPTQHSYVDQGADGLPHTYYVVTVDSHLKESTPAGGVTG
jgi:hypothetical protein